MASQPPGQILDEIKLELGRADDYTYTTQLFAREVDIEIDIDVRSVYTEAGNDGHHMQLTVIKDGITPAHFFSGEKECVPGQVTIINLPPEKKVKRTNVPAGVQHTVRILHENKGSTAKEMNIRGVVRKS